MEKDFVKELNSKEKEYKNNIKVNDIYENIRKL